MHGLYDEIPNSTTFDIDRTSIIDKAVATATSDLKLCQLPPSILQINGMSSTRVRWLLNEVCRLHPYYCNYVELGTWRGSTLISASYKNNGFFIGVDNFSQYFRRERTRRVLHRNIRTHWQYSKPMFIESDINKLDLQLLPMPDIFFYDAGHDRKQHADAIARYSINFPRELILIVDDWCRKSAFRGTRDGLKKIKHKVVHEVELKTDGRDDTDSFWNGIYLAHLKT